MQVQDKEYSFATDIVSIIDTRKEGIKILEEVPSTLRNAVVNGIISNMINFACFGKYLSKTIEGIHLDVSELNKLFQLRYSLIGGRFMFRLEVN